ncbi:MAG: dihydrofolate reductase [Clostridia bacterium]|nr:dihydrofolate reductase [Clostridia bacterium]
MKLIVAVDKKWGIGKKNGLLFSLPEDMKFFRETTRGKVVCMGYNTLLSFPESKPLKGRINLVLAPEGVTRDDCTVVHTLEAMFDEIKKYDDGDVFVIGGAMFYRTMYPYCDEAYITKVDADGGAEVFFDDLDKLDNWSYKVIDKVRSESGIELQFTLYTNASPEKF